VVIGDRIRELLESKDLSQGEIQKRRGLLRSYQSRAENNRMVPGIEPRKVALVRVNHELRNFRDWSDACLRVKRTASASG
jgi:transcriptional regulator with XRE-family HTH domain